MLYTFLIYTAVSTTTSCVSMTVVDQSLDRLMCVKRTTVEGIIKYYTYRLEGFSRYILCTCSLSSNYLKLFFPFPFVYWDLLSHYVCTSCIIPRQSKVQQSPWWLQHWYISPCGQWSVWATCWNTQLTKPTKPFTYISRWGIQEGARVHTCNNEVHSKAKETGQLHQPL